MSEQPPPTFDFDAPNAEYIEALLSEYQRSPQRVSASWQRWFRELAEGNGGADVQLQPQQPPSLRPRSLFNPPGAGAPSRQVRTDAQHLQQRADKLVEQYRTRGHLRASLDPLGMAREEVADFSPQAFGISRAELQQTVRADLAGESAETTVGRLIERLEEAYCGHIGVQLMHIEDAGPRSWLLQRIERPSRTDLTNDERHRILRLLTEAVVFEEFMRKKYIGAKTFSLEGAETLIPLLDLAIEHAAGQGVEEIVIGMPHRGRLNVLSNIIGQPLRQIFAQFEDKHPEQYIGGGDVKYHLGASGDRKTASGRSVHLSLCFNPSHLEFVNPVALGRVRAKQDREGDPDRQRRTTFLIHGDAAFAGEGIVQETLNFSQLKGYTTGGTLHVIVNNQLGFTTPPEQGRSTRYASDVARLLQVPIFHVNGEHPEAVAHVVKWAMDFRRRFQRDVVIDMYCFRRFGHNEADEPSFTQPRLYQAIEHHPPLRQNYLEDLAERDGISQEEADSIAESHYEHLKKEYEAAQEYEEPSLFTPRGVWEGYFGGPEPNDPDVFGQVDDREPNSPETGVSTERLASLLQRLTETPDGFHLHRKLRRSVEQRREMAAGERPVDWSAAEALAIAALAVDGHPVRLSGQDSQRGTFSQRHSVLHDAVDGHGHHIFSHLSEDQAPVEIINSPLNEAGVMGFDYGYSLDYPSALVAWEGQFGDFANAGQVIIDQFITSAEDKWQRLSGLILLLPHGFEGQGPEHSSARLERLLALAAEDNMQVVCPTTAAQYFHVLRRQVKRRWRKPLVVLTPKSLLRHPRVASPLEDFASGGFRRLLPDERESQQDTRRILLCSGKIYYELSEYREEQQHDDVAIVRVEQFYPLPDEYFQQVVGQYDRETPVVWVQEEPINMGAWPRWRRRFGESFLEHHRLSVVARRPSASPATGSKGAHKLEQQELLQQAFE